MPERSVVIATYAHEHFGGIDALWREAFPDDPPWNRAEAAIQAKLAVQPELLLANFRRSRDRLCDGRI